MLASCSEYICARWNALMRPAGDSMKTSMPRRPRIAYSAAEPVSPEVAPSTLSRAPRCPSTYSKSAPSNCIAMSLKASVGPLDSSSRPRPGSSQRSGVIALASLSGRALPYTSAV